MMNWQGWEFFAPESLLTKDGRRVMWAWCKIDNAQTQSDIQSLPRELSLPEDGVLRIKPLRELESLRGDEKSVSAISIKSDSSRMLDGIAGDTLELDITFQPTAAKEYGVNVFCDAKGAGFPITVKPESKNLVMGNSEASFEVKPGEALNLRIFLDKGMVEVFANERQSVVSMQPHKPEEVGVGIFSKGADVEVKDIKSWKMQSIYQK